MRSVKIASMAAIDIDELFDRTLQGDYDDDAPWGAVNALRRIGTRQVFEKAAEWFSVACALGSLPNDALSVATLLTLMEDADEDVRAARDRRAGRSTAHSSKCVSSRSFKIRRQKVARSLRVRCRQNHQEQRLDPP